MRGAITHVTLVIWTRTRVFIPHLLMAAASGQQQMCRQRIRETTREAVDGYRF
jgi:hypothetical protein